MFIAISQHNYLAAVDLIFSLLTPPVTSPHQSIVFDSVSLRELTLLSPRQRQVHLQILMNKCRPMKKPRRRRRNTPPPVPPRPPVLLNSIEPRSAPPLSWIPNPRADSDSDFEDSEVVHKIRFSARAGSAPDVVAHAVKQPKPVKMSLGGSVKRKPKRKFSLRRSRSVDFLDSPLVGHRGSITSMESVAYSLPFQHLERWRRMVGVSDTSAVTGSMPCLDCNDNSFEYIDTGQFRNIVSSVRQKSTMMGSHASERVMRRVDSVVRTHRSRAATNLYSSAVYLSLVGEDQLPWVADTPVDTRHTVEKKLSSSLPAHNSPHRTVGFKCDTSSKQSGYASTPSSPLKKHYTYNNRGSSVPMLPLPRPPVPPRTTRPHPQQAAGSSYTAPTRKIKDDKVSTCYMYTH